MNRLLLPLVLAALLLSGCSLLPSSGGQRPTDAAGVQKVFEAAVKKMGIDYLGSFSIDADRMVVIGYKSATGNEQLSYNAEWGSTASVFTEPVDTSRPAIPIPVGEVDMAARYQAAADAAGCTTDSFYYSFSYAIPNLPIANGRCAGYDSPIDYALLGDQEWTQFPDFGTAAGAEVMLSVLDALGADQLLTIDSNDRNLAVEMADELDTGLGQPCAWGLTWQPNSFSVTCTLFSMADTAFSYSEINKQAFPAAWADTYAHTGNPTTAVSVQWDDELQTPIISTFFINETGRYGYRADGTPLQ